MFSSRYIRPNRFFCHLNRSFCQSKIQPKSWLEKSKTVYDDYLPFAIPFSFIASLFSVSDPESHESTFGEFFISNITIGLFVGLAYPISFPLITLNVLRKRIQKSSKPSGPEDKRS